jgi:two-component system NtrC family sensor kinase
VAVNELILDVINFVSLKTNSAERPIGSQLLADDDVIVADKDALRQVLINCLFNAVDATSSRKGAEREIVILTSHEHSSALSSLTVISILDNGTGIAEEQLQYLFDPFFTTKEVGRGTGLGLFVCHTIMERLNGTITLSNRNPTGVEVKIALPLLRAADSKQQYIGCK